ncbi:MAG: type I-C CRISPR-associated protein Cas8c/Csd1 [Dehalococcoidia bacterium]|nr:type I-C CRISPR-associated protein Cas8c/Csd1 [Dehalococcoidia bacterium]
MLLQKLVEYSGRMNLPPPLYREKPLRYIIELDSNGRFLGLTDAADPADRELGRGQPRALPDVQRSSGIRPLLLADKADYAVGLGSDGDKGHRVRSAHAAFKNLLIECAEATKEPSLGAVRQFLDGDPLDQLKLDDEFDQGATISFSVSGLLPTDLPSVQAFWAAQNDPEAQGAVVMQCVVCGEDRPVLERLQEKIKGVPGGQTSGTSIISANADAFESYGLEASLISPTCGSCGERLTKAANQLLGSESSRVRMAGAAFVFWTAEDVEFDFIGSFTSPDPEAVKQLIESVRSGRPIPGLDDAQFGTKFYGSVLSGSGGRAVVRDWVDVTVRDVREQIVRWHIDHAIVGAYGEAPTALGLTALVGATVRELRDVPVTTFRAMLRAGMTGTPLPHGLLYQAVRRNRAEQDVTRPRAALIKLVLKRLWARSEEDFMVQLEANNPDVAYQCGRLLAVLEQVQRQALPGIKAGIVDRFFGTASTASRSVFPRLLRGAQPHLGKLERDRRGAYVALQGRLEEILFGLTGQSVDGARLTFGEVTKSINSFPAVLNLEQQGLFSLGYYHQRAFDRQQARAAAERKRQGVSSEPEAELADESAPAD